MTGQNETARTTVDPWEAAYVRFETPAEETAKFRRRLVRLGAARWPRDSRVLELCCGRGNGLVALAELGFARVTGLDLSRRLLALGRGTHRVVQSDCRMLPVREASLDLVIVQGGLHHLLALPQDLERTLGEAHRVLRADGRFVAVEPWRTPFLDVVHWAASSRALCRISDKLSAFSTMVAHERETYERWLASPALISGVLETYFVPEVRETAWGKLCFVGTKRASG